MFEREAVHPIRFRQGSALAGWQGFLLSCAVLGSLASANCGAQTSGVLTTEIAPQSLSEALSALAHQASVQLIYVSDLTRGRVSKGAPAGLPVTEALTRLLAGTGLRFEFINARTVRLLPASAAGHSARPPRLQSSDAHRKRVECLRSTERRS